MAGIVYETTSWTEELLKRYLFYVSTTGRIIETADQKLPGFRELADDVYARMYLHERMPRVPESGHTPWAAPLMQYAESLEEWRSLRYQCATNPLFCGVASGTILKILAELIKEIEQLGVGGMSREMADAIKSAVGEALNEIDGISDAVNDISEALGLNAGKDATRPPTLHDISSIYAIYDEIKDHPALKSIIALAGRMRRDARATRKGRVADPRRGDIKGVDVGMPRVIPSELAALASDNPYLKIGALHKLLTHKALGYTHKPVPERLGKGPIVAMLDCSSSMVHHGVDRLSPAKAVVLNLIERAKKERRAFGLVGFNGRPFPPLVIPIKGEQPVDGIIHALRWGSSGGTSFDAAIAASIRIIEEDRRQFHSADIILVTDGDDTIGAKYQEVIRGAQAAYGTSFYLIAIGDDAARIIRENKLGDIITRAWVLNDRDLGDSGGMLSELINP